MCFRSRITFVELPCCCKASAVVVCNETRQKRLANGSTFVTDWQRAALATSVFKCQVWLIMKITEKVRGFRLFFSPCLFTFSPFSFTFNAFSAPLPRTTPLIKSARAQCECELSGSGVGGGGATLHAPSKICVEFALNSVLSRKMRDINFPRSLTLEYMDPAGFDHLLLACSRDVDIIRY